jgi:hypothetical protein
LRPKRLLSLTAAVGFILSAGTLAGIGTVGAATPQIGSPSSLLAPLTATTTAPAPAPAAAAGPASTLASTPASDPLAKLAQLPVSLAVPITVLGNEIAGTVLPGQDARTGTNTTTQISPLANVDAPTNACSVSAGPFANANSRA